MPMPFVGAEASILLQDSSLRVDCVIAGGQNASCHTRIQLPSMIDQFRREKRQELSCSFSRRNAAGALLRSTQACSSRLSAQILRFVAYSIAFNLSERLTTSITIVLALRQ